MRKNFFVCALMLILPMLACAFTPAELTGTWTSGPVEVSNEGSQTAYLIPSYTFAQDGSCTDNTVMVFKEAQGGISIEIKIRAEIPGIYTIEGDEIKFTNDYNKASIVCTKDDIEVKAEMPSDQKAQFVEGLYQMVNYMLIPQVKEKQVNDPNDIWTNVALDASTLSYVQNEINFTLTRK